MRLSKPLRPALAALAIAAALPAAAADAAAGTTATTTTSGRTGTTDRLFLAFVQDAAIVPSQWWEGQIEYVNGGNEIPADAFIVRGVVAFQPVKYLEVGGKFGLGNTNTDPPLPEGTGATDLDIFAKYLFHNVSDHLDFTAGVDATIPTGDDNVGLGFNSFAAQAFGGMRYTMESAIIGGHVGVRFNGDGSIFGADLAGKTSFELGVHVLFPMANQVTITGEAQIETARFDGMDSTAQIVGGVNWKAWQRGLLRASLAAGLTNATPNFRVLVGYAYTF